MSRSASEMITKSLQKKPDQLFCVATGNSPMGVYKNLTESYDCHPELFEKLRILKLDEWGGIPSTDTRSCETFIQKRILRPLQVPPDRYISFTGDAPHPEAECDRMCDVLSKITIDSCILGLGKNGHIGFNEPGEALNPHFQRAELSKEAKEHTMVETMPNKPRYGLTLGMADILQSKTILLLVTGSDKRKAIRNLLTGQITTRWPASLLWLHPHVHCFIDEGALERRMT
jgi:galactosamine-6-phosphate isomerase